MRRHSARNNVPGKYCLLFIFLHNICRKNSRRASVTTEARFFTFSLSGAYLMLKCETRRRGVHKGLGLRLLFHYVYIWCCLPQHQAHVWVVVIMLLLLTSDIALKRRISLFIMSHTLKSNDTLLTSDTCVKLCNCVTDSCFLLYFLCRRTINFG